MISITVVNRPEVRRRNRLAGSAGAISIGLFWLLGAAGGCTSRSAEEVVVYTALDEEFSRPIFAEFERATGIAVRAKYDVESTKSVQLTQALLAERDRPRCDVFWNNEVVNTLRLESAGALTPYLSPQGANYPAQHRSPSHGWYGFAARARVLLVNTEIVDSHSRPTSITDLTDPRWADRAGIAKPLAGTTATHAACLFAAWGDARAKEFFAAIKKNARVLGGNKQVARAVADGELAFGLTDTDDAIIEIESGKPVAIVYPDQEGDEALGTLFIPNTLSIVKGAPHEAAAKRLVEYLLSPEVEERLAKGPSAQFPLHPQARVKSRAAPASEIRAMQVDFDLARERWDDAAAFLRDEFASAE